MTKVFIIIALTASLIIEINGYCTNLSRVLRYLTGAQTTCEPGWPEMYFTTLEAP